MSSLWSVDDAKTRWCVSFTVIKKNKNLSTYMVSQIHADKLLWTTSSKGLWGTRSASSSIICWQRKGGVRTWVRARGRCPLLSWPLGCSQPVLLYCHLVRGWGLHFTGHSWGQVDGFHPLLRGGIKRALPVGPEVVSVGSVLKKATWPLHPFHSALWMPAGPPSSTLGRFCPFLLFPPLSSIFHSPSWPF